MKKVFCLNLLIALMVCCLTIGAAGCAKNTVSEHDHVWGEGVITTEPTCYKEGVRTYTCTVAGCEQTKTAPVAMIPHTYDEGKVTKEPTCKETGVKIYTCTEEGCTHTKEETIAKTEHSYDEGSIVRNADFLTAGERKYTCTVCGDEKRESIPAHADFSEQFGKDGWVYGYASSFNNDTGALAFVRVNEADGAAYKADGVEITANGVKSEKIAVIAYEFTRDLPEKTEAIATISFKGEESNTSMKAYLVIKDKVIALNGSGAKDWNYASESAFGVEKGDTVYLVFENNGTGAAEGELSFTLKAKCLHVRNGGEVIKETSCSEEGQKKYTCVSCGDIYIETIEKIAHEYDEGQITVEPTTDHEGEKTYTCKKCGATNTEKLPKIAEFNGASYTEDFTLTGSGNWKYGYTTDFNFDSNKFTFKALSAATEAWIDSENGIELKSDWIRNERGGANTVITYVMPKTEDVTISLNFKGSSDVTRITGRLQIEKADGTVQICDFISGIENSIWNYEKKVTVERDSRISIIFFNEGSNGYYHGKFSMNIAKGTATPENPDQPDNPEQPESSEVANYYDDFSTAGDNNWVYGYATDYQWDGEHKDSFTFNALTAVDENEWGGKDGIIIKKDWILSESGDAAIGYKVQEGQSKLNVTMTFTHAPDSETNGESPTRFAIRLLVVGSDGYTKSMQYLYNNTSSFEFTRDVEVSEGDTVYAVLFKEADGWRQGRLQIVITD